MDYRISPLTEADDATAVRVQALLNQLSVRANAGVTGQTLKALIADELATLFVATKDDEIFGVLTISALHVANGLVAWIEAVVVDADHRGRGIGRSLMGAAIDEAAGRGCLRVILTAEAQIKNAVRLYRDLGFAKDKTDFYELHLT